MQNSDMEVSSSSVSRTAKIDAPVPAFGKLTSAPSKALTKILLVEFRNGEAVTQHPELSTLLSDGWSVRSAVPRIVESEGTKLLVVMAKPDSSTRFARS